MGVETVNAIVLQTSGLDKVVEFYKALGFPLEEEKHGGGPVHFACYFMGLHFAVYPSTQGRAVSRGSGGATMLGFQVSQTSKVLAQLKALNAPIIVENQKVPWGTRTIVEDPDGRSIELNEV